MTFVNAIPVLAVAAVAVVLLMGLWNMMRGGSASRSQNLMRWRVGLQFLAIILLMAALWWSQRGA
jgi:Hypoxia induced protein conserved region